MNAPGLPQLVDRFGLAPTALTSLEVFAGLLATDPLAPTAVRDPARIRDDHLADSLIALELPMVRKAGRVADIGSGAGLPGLPLALALPSAEFILSDGNGRKCEFMARAAQDMGLQNVDVRHTRAEELSQLEGQMDLVTARALASLDVVAEYAAPLLRVGGHLLAWRGQREPEVEAQGQRAAEILGLCVQEPIRVRPYPTAEHRYLHLMSKVRETPARFPRRPGVARKRPLGASGGR